MSATGEPRATAIDCRARSSATAWDPTGSQRRRSRRISSVATAVGAAPVRAAAVGSAAGGSAAAEGRAGAGRAGGGRAGAVRAAGGGGGRGQRTTALLGRR